MSGPPMEYDPRRLFPFGLSPIPEVPSELASEVSSVYSYNCDDEDSEADTTEVEGAKTPGSIMYSGSCSSVKSNGTVGTLEDKGADSLSEDSGKDEESEEEEEEEEDDTDDFDEEDEDRVIIEAKSSAVEKVAGAIVLQTSNQEEVVTVENVEITEIQEETVAAAVEETTATYVDKQEELVTMGQQILDEEDEGDREEDDDEQSEEESSEEDECCENLYSSQVTAVTHQRAFNIEQENSMQNQDGSSSEQPSLAIVPSASSSNLNPTPGAIAATEIFHHLQATRGKEEVTTELAKILSVLQTTLKDGDDESSSSSGSEDSGDSKEPTPEPTSSREHHKPNKFPMGKPPLHPSSFKCAKKMGPEIQQRIRDLAKARPEKGKEEMSILSKILVTLLCSCKSVEATMELKKIIRHFREAASEASDDIGEEMLPIRASRTSSRASKRRRRSRSRRSSANSNGSNTSQSEAESLTNTLTPCNTDSKSSGTDDEGGTGSKRCSVCKTPTNEASSTSSKVKHAFGLKIADDAQTEQEANVTFTVSLPRRASIEVAEITASISPTKMLSNEQEGNDDAEDDNEEEWEWEDDDDAGSGTSSKSAKQRKKRQDSTSSRELSSAELKEQNSMASSTRKLFNDMEFGAYNSDSMYSPGHSGQSDGVSMSEQSHESPALESDFNMEEGKNNSEDEEDEEEEDDEEEEEEEEENLYSHLEETYRVLNGTYQIITGAQTESTTTVQSTTNQSDNVISTNTNNTSNNSNLLKPPSRPSSKMSRPGSRRSVRNAKDDNKEANEEDDWGDDEGDWEWEYYYDEDEEGNENQEVKSTEVVGSAPQSNQDPVASAVETDNSKKCGEEDSKLKETKPTESVGSTTESKSNIASGSRPVSRQRKIPMSSRPGSRTGSRPSSRASRKEGHLGEVCEEQEGEDWEWEYYYEEDEEEFEAELDRLSPTATTAPTTRATSPFPDQNQALKLMLKYAESSTEPPWQMEALISRNIGLPSFCRAFETFHSDPDWYNPISELSVALAAEYLGQKSEEVAKSLPVDFVDTQSNLDKSEKTGSNHKSSSRKKKKGSDEGGETNSKESGEKKHKKKKKKKGDGKFLPKITVRDLVNMLEPQLFKDDDSGTKMVMQEETVRSSIAKQKKSRSKELSSNNPPALPPPVVQISQPSKTPPSVSPHHQKESVDEPIKKEVVIIHDPKNPNQVEVCMDGQSTFVTMRPHSRRSLGARSKDSNKKGKQSSKSGISKDKNQSPSESEAYGTGSSVSEALDGSNQYPPGEDLREDQPSRHSRLLKILQESEESDCFNPCSSDHDSVASLPHTGGVAVERKLSFRSMKSSGRESDGDSISGELHKPSPPSLRKGQNLTAPSSTAAQRFMNLNLQSCYNMDPITPSSSELSTPSSPGYLDYTQVGSLERRSKRMSAPTTPSSFRMWPIQQESETENMASEVEDIMKRKASSSTLASPLARTLHESRLMSNASPLNSNNEMVGRGSPATFRNSPAGVRTSSPSIQSPTYRHSPKLEQELMELGQLPPSTTTHPYYSSHSLPRSGRWNK